jgi:hypothetical protein
MFALAFKYRTPPPVIKINSFPKALGNAYINYILYKKSDLPIDRTLYPIKSVDMKWKAP